MSEPETKPRVKYACDPIQEAICEVHFEAAKSLTPEMIQQIKPVWEASYPNQQLVTERTLQVHLGLDKADMQTKDVGHKLIARSKDGKDLAQLGPRFLAVNRLNPYTGWEESFRETIKCRAGEVVRTYGFENVERIGLRYINRIQFPERPLRWADWLAMRLPVPGDLGQAGGVFQFHFEQELSPGLQGIVSFVTLPPPPDQRTCVILDIDVIWRGSEPLEQLGSLLETVHGPHHDLFESYLLDKTRHLFEIQP